MSNNNERLMKLEAEVFKEDNIRYKKVTSIYYVLAFIVALIGVPLAITVASFGNFIDAGLLFNAIICIFILCAFLCGIGKVIDRLQVIHVNNLRILEKLEEKEKTE